jgi:hypothetical protein
MVGVAQSGDFSGCLLENPVADFEDQAGIFRNRNEFFRADKSLARMLPANQSFCFVYFPGSEIDDRLIMQQELVVGECLSEIARKTHSDLCCLLHRWGEVLVAVAPMIFCGIHGLVSISQ